MDSSLLSGTLEGENVRGLQRVFPLYVVFPESRWNEIKKAESLDEVGNKAFSALREEYIALGTKK
jgi:hypothetical protein